MTMLSPSILSADFAALGSQCRQVLEAGADMLHFDVMDGHFVPNISYGAPVLKSLHKALPDALFDVHLMISHPLQYAADFAAAGAGIITFHLEAEDPVEQTIGAIHALGCRAGLSVKPGTPVEAVLPWLDQLELVLVMSVEPGFGGQKFQPQALQKLRTLAAVQAGRQKPLLLQVDGGVALESGTAGLCVQAGANLLVAGSAVFSAPDPAAAVAALRAL